jgi:hypothetical protein
MTSAPLFAQSIPLVPSADEVLVIATEVSEHLARNDHVPVWKRRMSLNDTLEARHLPGRVTPVVKEGLRHKIRRADETGFKTLQIGDKPVQSRDLFTSVELHDSRASTKIGTR